MYKRLTNPAALALVASTMLGLGAQAGSVVLDFSGPDGPVTTPPTNVLTRSAGGFTATAGGFNADGTALQLYIKNDGGDEKGVGFASTNDHELTLTESGRAPANFIQIDVSQFYHSTPGASITMGSVTDTESFNIFGTNTAGTLPGTPLNPTPFGSAFAGTPVAIPQWGTYKYIDVAVAPDHSHPDDNVLFGAITVTQAVPEPASIVMGSTAGLVALGYWLRRRMANAAARATGPR